MNNPLIFTDPDGRSPVFHDEESAARAADDLNRLISRLFDTDVSAFNVVQGTYEVTVAREGDDVLNKVLNFLIGGVSQKVEGFSIQVNSDFDFSGGNLTDEQKGYLGELQDVINSEHNVLVEFTDSVNGIPLGSARNQGSGVNIVGGYTPNINQIFLAHNLARTGEERWGEWSVSAVFMHETIHHLHKNAVGRDPRHMNRVFGFPYTTNHQGGIPKNRRPFGQ